MPRGQLPARLRALEAASVSALHRQGRYWVGFERECPVVCVRVCSASVSEVQTQAGCFAFLPGSQALTFGAMYLLCVCAHTCSQLHFYRGEKAVIFSGMRDQGLVTFLVRTSTPAEANSLYEHLLSNCPKA
jgi:hypothetical protein